MSGGYTCKCGQHKKPVEKRRWLILKYMHNHSAFSGYHKTASDYSSIKCLSCGALWRTKARYVGELPYASGKGWDNHGDGLDRDAEWEGEDRQFLKENQSRYTLRGPSMTAIRARQIIYDNGGAVYTENGVMIAAEFMCFIRRRECRDALEKAGFHVGRIGSRLEINLPREGAN